MEMLDRLLQLIVQLQNNGSVLYGRHALLDHVLESSGARLASLFILDRERQVLVLLEYAGQLPSSLTQNDCTILPINGLFGLALTTQLSVSDLCADARALLQEQAWGWSGGYVLINTIRGSHDAEQGILVLSFKPGDQQRPESQSAIQVCLSLLSVYLAQESSGGRVELPTRATARVRPYYDTRETSTGRHSRGGPSPSPWSPEQQVAIDEERRRIARDLHDGASQHITHVLHKLEFVQHLLEKQSLELAQVEIRQSRKVLEAGLHDLRHDISSLAPAQLEEQGFVAALQDLLNEYAISNPTLKITCDIAAPSLLLSKLEGPIFRFIQEALNNVRKHARATQVAITLRMLPALLVVEVSDNGIGLQPAQASNGSAGKAEDRRDTRHFGLRMMRERIQEAEGILEIQSVPGKGTTVKARFPMSSAVVPLTQRERDVLRLLVDGLTNRDIAQRLSVSTETVKSHVHHIMQKMHVKDRTQAAVLATKQRWLS